MRKEVIKNSRASGAGGAEEGVGGHSLSRGGVGEGDGCRGVRSMAGWLSD